MLGAVDNYREPFLSATGGAGAFRILQKYVMNTAIFSLSSLDMISWLDFQERVPSTISSSLYFCGHIRARLRVNETQGTFCRSHPSKLVHFKTSKPPRRTDAKSRPCTEKRPCLRLFIRIPVVRAPREARPRARSLFAESGSKLSTSLIFIGPQLLPTLFVAHLLTQVKSSRLYASIHTRYVQRLIGKYAREEMYILFLLLLFGKGKDRPLDVLVLVAAFVRFSK